MQACDIEFPICDFAFFFIKLQRSHKPIWNPSEKQVDKCLRRPMEFQGVISIKQGKKIKSHGHVLVFDFVSGGHRGSSEIVPWSCFADFYGADRYYYFFFLGPIVSIIIIIIILGGRWGGGARYF